MPPYDAWKPDISLAGKMCASPGEPRPVGFARRATLLTALAGAAWLGGNVTLQRLLPRFDLPGTELKLEALYKGDDGTPYDTLFLGSSRTWHGFMPSVFEAAAASAGHELHAFNFGLEGMAAVASWGLLEQLAGEPPPGLRWILIDPEVLHKVVRDRQPLARGVIGWHGPEQSWWLIRHAWQPQLPLDVRLSAIAGHAHSTLYRLAGVGRGAELVGQLLGSTTAPGLRDILGPRGDGFEPFPGQHKADFTPDSADWQHFLKRRGEMARPRRVQGELSDRAGELFTTLAERVRALGATPVFVSGPSINPQRQLLEAWDRGIIENLLVFDRPDLYPDLYTLAGRWGLSYLNAGGARAYSRHLGEAFAALIDSKAAAK